MKRMIMLLAVVPLVFLFVAADSGEQETVWVSSDGAMLKEDRKASSDTIAELPVGMELTVLKYKKRWYHVTTPDDQNGWIYRGKISKEPPEADGESEGDSTGQLLSSLTGSDIESDEADTARSIRGLSPEAKEYAKNAGTPQECQDALDQVLAYKTMDDDIQQLLKEEKIGEYAD
ncbi:MAG: SH3 domain-containing protein [Desulfobacterales bacterium]|nr:SH3 domain-containing protein [Desulfobacterales bacterium]